MFHRNTSLHRTLGVLLLAATLPAACRRDDVASPTLPADTFVDVMAALRQASAAGGSGEEFAVLRDSILRDAGVTDSALLAFVRVHGSDPRRMAAIWDSVAARLRTDDVTRPEPEGAPADGDTTSHPPAEDPL